MVGRFLNPDNFVQQPGNTQSYNRYSYCLNNPLRYTDPNGEFFLSLIAPGVGTVVDVILWGMLIDYSAQVISNIADQKSNGHKINMNEAAWGDIDFLDVAVSGAVDGLTMGIGKVAKLPKYAKIGLKAVSIIGGNTLKARYDLTPDNGLEVETDSKILSARLMSSSVTSLTFGTTYDFGLDKIAGEKIVGNALSKNVIGRIKNYAIKSVVSYTNDNLNKATFNDIMKLDHDYYYNHEESDWQKKVLYPYNWPNNY